MNAAVPVCVWEDLGAELGEGPVWSAAEQALWFVDIKRSRIHRHHPASGRNDSWDAPAAPGFLAPRRAGGFIVGLSTGLHLFDPVLGFQLLDALPQEPGGNRLNDGAVDPFGRLWFGSMHDAETQPTGRLYRLDPDGARAMDSGYVITNGPAFSPDGRVLYHTDTLARTIYAFDLDTEGVPGGKRVFVRIEDGAGYPDGPVVDSEGCLWTGLFGGWAARRYSAGGKLLSEVRFPCANVTKLAFGGPELCTVYATTARKGLSPSELAAQPAAGGLFRFEVATPGPPQAEVADV